MWAAVAFTEREVKGCSLTLDDTGRKKDLLSYTDRLGPALGGENDLGLNPCFVHSQRFKNSDIKPKITLIFMLICNNCKSEIHYNPEDMYKYTDKRNMRQDQNIRNSFYCHCTFFYSL